MLNPTLPALNDAEGENLPGNLPFVVDAHVHVFPAGIFTAVWDWFDTHAWPIRYRLSTTRILSFLLSHGIRHVVALQYAHKPGISRMLNQYLAKKCREFPGQVSGMATVFPGEDQAEEILKEAFRLGLSGVKLHAHVQCFDMNAPEMDIIYQTCASENKPLVMHVGREPKSPAYRCDPYEICSADKLARVIHNYPQLKVCVPHFGFDETRRYHYLIEKYDNLWLDTTMVLSDYFPLEEPIDLKTVRSDRVMYGSDFPNIPYAWDRELKWLSRSALSRETLSAITGENAVEFFQLTR
jgi:predicted TIM-barrel fold metal-dependent hydrolase